MGACMLLRARGGRGGRRVRRGLLPVQRGDGLVLPLPRGGLGGRLLPRRRVRARARRGAQRAAVPREPPRAPALPLQASRAEGGRARAAAAARVASAPRARVPRRARPGVSRGRGLARLGRRGDARRALRWSSSTSGSRSRPRVVLAPGWLLARALGVRSASATLAWSLVVVFGSARGHIRARLDAEPDPRAPARGRRGRGRAAIASARLAARRDVRRRARGRSSGARSSGS